MNKEKQDELFKLLRKYNIEDMTPLGAGTNRYTFRYKGFAVKFATDSDGKTDNMKEFKMSKLLQPYVTKTYEISEDGLLLVCEFVQPFQSFTEMLAYSDKIREILTKLSSVYLLGDVGITSKNSANWGLRIGTRDPVCLDYAYVFDVSSDLFICPNCKSGSMLMPTKDFTSLVCPNLACGKVYTFEEIRMRISNERHIEEIGDLSEIGYLLTESGEDTELIPSKSQYLEIKKNAVKEKKKEVEEIVEQDNFIYDNNKEDEMMNYSPDGTLIVKAVVLDQGRERAAASSVAFSGDMETTVIEAEPIEETDEFMNEPEDDDDDEDEEEEIGNDVTVINYNDEFSDSFLKNISSCISKVSNKIGDDLYQRNVFDEIKDTIRKKREFPKSFYKAAQNAAFRSLVSFCNLQECEVKNTSGTGTHRDWMLNDEEVPVESVETLHFIERFSRVQMDRMDNAKELLEKYRSVYPDYPGINPLWKIVFINRLMQKYPISISGATVTAQRIGELWCYEEEEDGLGYDEEDNPSESDVKDLDEEETGKGFAAPIDDFDKEADEYDDTDDDEDDDEEESDVIQVALYPETGIIKISTMDDMGEVDIPIYTDIEGIDMKEEAKKYADEDPYEWLNVFRPTIHFKTANPERWIHEYNDQAISVKVAPIKTLDDGSMIMGMYAYGGITMYTTDPNMELGFEEFEVDDTSDTATVVRHIIKEAIDGTVFDHKRLIDKVIADNDVYPEDFMYECESNLNDEDGKDEKEEEPLTDAEQAVLDALGLGGEQNGSNEDTDSSAVGSSDVRDSEDDTESHHEEEKVEDAVTFTPIRMSDVE